MPTTADVLVEVRDVAHLNQNALNLIAAQAQDQFDAIRLWDSSPAKEAALLHLGRTISTYRNAQREALALRDDVAESLVALGAAVPDLPPTDGSVQWSAQEW